MPESRHRWAGSPAAPLADAARRMGTVWDETARRAAFRLPIRIPRDYLGLVREGDPEDPIRRIAWPDPEELLRDPAAIEDPVGESRLKPHRLVVRKYPDRALLLVTTRCHFYCRFCFRAGTHDQDPPLEELEEAIGTLRDDSGLREVILSGGDPLVLPDDELGTLLGWLDRIRSLQVIRIHTRAPVHDPPRVTADLALRLAQASPRPLWVVVHATHPRELTPAFEEAIARLAAPGIGLLNQTVLLAGVNADPAILEELFSGLYARRVKPYYLHHPDRIAGTGRFRVTIEEGLRIFTQLRQRLTGPALPAYVIDLPDGSGKIPVEGLIPVGGRVFQFRHPGGRISVYHDIRRE